MKIIISATLSILLIYIIFSIAWEKVDTRLVVINNSDKPIFFGYNTPYFDSLNESPLWPIDSLGYIRLVDNKLLDSSSLVLSHTNKAMHMFGSWNDIFINSEKTYFYIFDAKTVFNNNWQEVISKNLILKKIELNKKDIEKVHWKISYPK